MTNFTVSAFYHFTRLDDPSALKAPLTEALAAHGVRGTVLLASEGVNGTIAGPSAGIEAAMDIMRALPGCAALDYKLSTAREMPFYRLKVRLKKEIVTLGVPGTDPTARVGAYVAPEDWNALISDPDTIVIDTRNDYEVGIGTFEGAINPETVTFREFPAWFEKHRSEFEGKKVAMFCTGGIRCEKATSYVLDQGIEDVFHLKGGILKYLEHVPEAESLWHGDCFVFDDRVAVGHGLREGDYEMCRACRRPLDQAALASPNYVPGVSCDYCVEERTNEQRQRYAERQKQMEIAEEKGTVHIGAVLETSGKPETAGGQ
jgi:UPF0176 protein